MGWLGFRTLIWGLLALGGVSVLRDPGRAPGWVGAALVTTCWPLLRAWRAAGGTALRPAVLWGGVAVGFAVVAQALAWSEPLAGGRPLAGHWAYLSMLATL